MPWIEGDPSGGKAVGDYRPASFRELRRPVDRRMPGRS